MWPLNREKAARRTPRASGALPWERRGSGRARGRGPTLRAARQRERRETGLIGWVLALPVVAATLTGLVVGGHMERFGLAVVEAGRASLLGFGFAVDSITLSGRKETAAGDVLAALAVKRGAPILEVDCTAARQRLLALPWVADARVSRLLPGTIRVEIVEHKPVAVWQTDGRLRLIDSAGLAFIDVGPDALERFPHVVGADAAPHAAALIDMLHRFPDIESRVRAAVRVGERRWNLQLKNGIEIELPGEGVEEALGELAALHREKGVLDRDLRAIDMRLRDRWILRLPVGTSVLKPGPGRDT